MTESYYTAKELRNILRDFGLSTTGSKEQLLERLQKVYFCENWQTCITREIIGPFNYIILPANTLLYKGVSVGKKATVESGIYAADLSVASYYAFQYKSRPPDAEYGLVQTYKTVEPLYLLDMEDINNYEAIYEMGLEVPKTMENRDLLEYAFGYIRGERSLKRYSEFTIDAELVKWLCGLNKTLDGYAYEHIAGFHNEVVVCKNKGYKLVVEPVEYRYAKYYDYDSILKVKNGLYTGEKIPFSELEMSSSGQNYPIRPKDGGFVYFPSNRKEDRFLCTEEFHTARQIHVERNDIENKETCSNL